MLLPKVAKAEKPRARDALAFALGWVERCRGYVPLLEREQDRLLIALAEAWRRKQYAHVIQLVGGLAYIAGRLDNAGQGRRILLQGIQACREVGDDYHLALFLHRLSGLLFAQGAYTHARDLWNESLSIARTLGRTACLWEPLASFVYIIDLPQDYISVQQLAHTLLDNAQGEDPEVAAIALFMRGFIRHVAGDEEKTADDYLACMRLLESSTRPSLYKQFFEIEARAELARVQGDFALAHDYTLAAVSLSEMLCDPYMTATLLWDEGMFASRRGIFDDVYPLVTHMVSLARSIKAPHFFRWCAFLAHQLPAEQQSEIALALSRHIPLEATELLLPSPEHCDACVPVLSPRELEVLRCAANGCSNREIAARLVITIGTVKKHLEHIYTKLDVYSRTGAVARARELGLL